ncbi:hypothetical protein SDC9_162307 [bioreactor metagenome]|uniref:Uncharacterized protein n=1 Tax=bioreactor metagenome TaxID=1076179 RepID=A0A645FKP3_9ZZZZ
MKGHYGDIQPRHRQGQKETNNTQQPGKGRIIEVKVIVLIDLKILDKKIGHSQSYRGVVHQNSNAAFQKLAQHNIGPFGAAHGTKRRIRKIMDLLGDIVGIQYPVNIDFVQPP